MRSRLEREHPRVRRRRRGSGIYVVICVLSFLVVVMLAGLRWLHTVGSAEQGAGVPTSQEVNQVKEETTGVETSRLHEAVRSIGPKVTLKQAEELLQNFKESQDEIETEEDEEDEETLTEIRDTAIEAKGKKYQMEDPAIVVLTHSRVEDAVQRVEELTSLIDSKRFKLYLSCDEKRSFSLLEKKLKNKVDGIWLVPKGFSEVTHSFASSPLFKISEHFRFVLESAFGALGHSHVLLLEDDLVPAPDFLSLFRSTAWLLNEDPKLFCISAWNDNGFSERGWDPHKLMRTSFFPGLGWMTTHDRWSSLLRDKWPSFATTGWDHWLRVSGVIQGLDCVYPQVSRVKHVSKKGTNVKRAKDVERFSKLMFSSTPGSNEDVPTLFGDVSYLLYDNYVRDLASRIASARRGEGGVKLALFLREGFSKLHSKHGLWPSEPRGIFHGVIELPTRKNDGSGLILVEKREGREFLLPNERIDKAVGLVPTLGGRGVNCDETCKEKGMKCDAAQTFYVNDCEVMRKLHDCSRGCGNQVGLELPCIVVEPSLDTFQQCLISYMEFGSCTSQHKNTRRICPCIASSLRGA